jgi:hypothetical protein
MAFVVPSLALAASTVTLYKGDTVNATMDQQLDSSTAHVGDHFTMTVVPPYPEGASSLAGAKINGEVIKVTTAGQGRNPELYLAFNSVTLANGTSYPMNAEMTSGATQNKLKNGGHVALTTIGGMIAGNIIGKTIFHTNVGGAIGAASGFLVGYNKKSDLVVKQGSKVTLTLTQPLVVRRQTGG